MYTHIFENTRQGWHSWNQKVDVTSDRFILSLAKQLPDASGRFVFDYHTEFKVMLLAAALFVLLAVSLDIPHVNPGIQFTACLTVVVLLTQPLVMNLSSCLRSKKLMFQPAMGFFSPPPHSSGLSFRNLWDNVSSKVTQTVKKLTFQPKTDLLSQEVQNESNRLISKICALMAQIKEFDYFILKRRDLLKLTQRFLQEDAHLISISLTDTFSFGQRELDHKDLFDRFIQLNQKFNRLEHLWAERISFLQRHPILEERMLAHMKNVNTETPRNIYLIEYSKIKN